MDRPTLPSKSPYVIERRERHPSGATYVTFLAPGGATTEPRWVSFGEAKQFLTARDIERSWPFLAPELRQGIEPWSLTIRSWDEVFRERKALFGKTALSRQAPDFPQGQEGDDRANLDRLALTDDRVRRELWKREKVQEGLAEDFRNARSDDPKNRDLLAIIGKLQIEKKAIEKGNLPTPPEGYCGVLEPSTLAVAERGGSWGSPRPGPRPKAEDEWVLQPSSTLTVAKVLDRGRSLDPPGLN